MKLTDKINRFKEAMKSETDPDVIKSSKAILQGLSYFHLGINTELARRRFENSCKACPHNVPDPVTSMRVEDTKIKELSSKMCDHCGGCVLSYKIRQTIKKCEFWDE